MSKLILFQGDSITDCYRNYAEHSHMGSGYALQVQAHLGLEKPNKYTFLNRGISGNRIVDVYARIKSDIINLKPDYMSILIGVNDVWHELGGNCNGVSCEKFEKIYCMLIEEILEALPEIKIMVMEPFVLEGSATTATEDEPERWNIFYTEVRKRAEVAKRVAEKYNLMFIPLQEKFDEAAILAENSYWLYDGVHPTAMGHAVIKREWLKAFEIYKE